MKIDIVFLDNDLSDHEKYFDNQTIKEYCETHSFEGKKIKYSQCLHRTQRVII